MRNDNRTNNQLRSVTLEPNVNRYAEGSVIISFGNTKVLCTASVEENVPKWMAGKGQGWVTAEYGMLPRSTHTRIRRDKAMRSGRTQEISRLIGRSLRAVVDLEKLGERAVEVDCDVLQADGGTRTASVTGGFVALAMAFEKLMKNGAIKENPLTDYLAAISVGVTGSTVLVDLNYEEDSSIETDMNIVMTGDDRFVEIQGTAEGTPFSHQDLSAMTESARDAIHQLFTEQEKIIGSFFPRK